MWSIRLIRFFVTLFVLRGLGTPSEAFSLSSLFEEGQFFVNQSLKAPPLEEEVDSRAERLNTEEFRICGLMFVMQSYSWELPPPYDLAKLGTPLRTPSLRGRVFIVFVFKILCIF